MMREAVCGLRASVIFKNICRGMEGGFGEGGGGDEGLGGGRWRQRSARRSGARRLRGRGRRTGAGDDGASAVSSAGRSRFYAFCFGAKRRARDRLLVTWRTRQHPAQIYSRLTPQWICAGSRKCHFSFVPPAPRRQRQTRSSTRRRRTPRRVCGHLCIGSPVSVTSRQGWVVYNPTGVHGR
jgi:hypothetical protein